MMSMKIRPISILLFYLLLIVLFCLIYYCFADQWECPLSLVDSFYLSAVTITTLGYGDITPTGNVAKILVSVQAILGVATIGYFLVSVAQEIADLSTSKQSKISKQIIREQYADFRKYSISQVLAALDQENSTDWIEVDRLMKPENMFDRVGLPNSPIWQIVKHGFVSNGSFDEIKKLMLVFEKNIESFIYRSNSENYESINSIVKYRNNLMRLQLVETEEDTDSDLFMRALHQLLTQFDVNKEKIVSDEFLGSVEAI